LTIVDVSTAPVFYPAVVNLQALPLTSSSSAIGASLWGKRAPFDVLASLPEVVFGTGGFATDALFRALERGTTSVAARLLVVEDVAYIDHAQPTSEVVNAIRSAFGLSVTDLAAVLGVERPTIYSWLKDQSVPSASRLDRMGLVLRLADTWTGMAGAGVSPALTSTVTTGVDLLTALREPKLWEVEIAGNLRAQATAARNGAHGKKLIAVPRGHGADLRSRADFDVATGRPLGPER
jgi:transcriptional regulator with XRE-family HTH domain